MSSLTILDAIRAELTHDTNRWPTPASIAHLIDPRTVDTPALALIDKALVKLLDTPDGRLIISMPPQEGKALALDTPIATPSGWTTMGSLHVGDEVFGGDGHPCHVTWVSPIWRGRDCFAVTTGDGEHIIADTAHEWMGRLDRRRSPRIFDTAMLAKHRSKNAQITATALDLPEASLPLDPYVFGVWLGDGNTSGPIITCHPDDVAIRDRFAESGWPLKFCGRYRWSMIPEGWGNRGRFHPSPAKSALRELGVIGNKHIPDAYLRASREQRLALLQGLVDSDGYVMEKGQVEYCSTLKVLAEGVRELVYSLGAKATIRTGRATLNGKDCGTKYRVRFYLSEAAWLPRKAERCRDSSVSNVRYVSARPCASTPTVCIEVDSPDHLFLAGRTMLPTHNSTRCSRDLPVWALAHNPELRIVSASYAQGLANRNGRAVRNAISTNPQLGISIARDNGAASEWTLEKHRGGVLSVGRGAGVTGRPADLLLVDDPLRDRAEAESQTVRDTCWDWWTDALSARLAPGAPALLIMTRWHQGDLAGRLVDDDNGADWKVLNIPAECENAATDPLGREPGEFMRSARGRTTAQWEARKQTVGSRTWAALYQGHPSPAEGGLIHRDWWRTYDLPLWEVRPDGSCWTRGYDQLLMSADLTFTGGDTSDYVAIGVWARRGPDAWLLDQVHARMDFTATIAAFKRLAAKWPQAVLKLVEDKANGPALISSLAASVPGIVPYTPQGSKTARASAWSPLVESRHVWLPSPRLAPWVGDYIEECAQFPTGAHDDQVDQTSMALDRLMLRPLDTGIITDDTEPDFQVGVLY